MSSFEQKFVADVEALLHPIAEAVRKAVTAAQADFATEKHAIAAEVRAALAIGEADAKALAAAVEDALTARGL